MHSSILTDGELVSELGKISQFYEQDFPFKVNVANAYNFKTIISPQCIIHNKEIIYTLILPLFNPKIYNLYYLLPVPNKYFQIIIPKSNYILNSYSDSKLLMQVCDKISDKYYCRKNSISYMDPSCEKSVLWKIYGSTMEKFKDNITK